MEPSAPGGSRGMHASLGFLAARPVTWVRPAWATICGALSSGVLPASPDSVVRLALAVLLTDIIVGAWRTAWVDTDWASPIRFWHSPQSSTIRAHQDFWTGPFQNWLLKRSRYLRRAVLPHVGIPIAMLLSSLVIALMLAASLGTLSLVLTLASMILALVESQDRIRNTGYTARALAQITVPWLIGFIAFANLLPSFEASLFALFFGFAYRGLLTVKVFPDGAFTLINLAQVAVAIILLARGVLFFAGLVAISVIAQVLWQALARSGRDQASLYVRRAQWFVLASMLIAALSLVVET